MKHIILDCDGVILNSNKLKTAAFAQTIRSLGLPGSEQLAAFNRDNGGITALNKFNHYVQVINPGCSFTPQSLERSFRNLVFSLLKECEHDPFFDTINSIPGNFKLHIISGGNQTEIIETLKYKNLLRLFEGHILGNPADKFENFMNIKKSGIENAVYVGDSKLDYELAVEFGFDFVFIHQWTEVKNWRDWTTSNEIKIFQDLKSYFSETLNKN